MAVLNALPDDEKARLKVTLRDNEVERKKYATSLASRFLKETLVPTEAEIARAQVALEKWYL